MARKKGQIYTAEQKTKIVLELLVGIPLNQTVLSRITLC